MKRMRKASRSQRARWRNRLIAACRPVLFPPRRPARNGWIAEAAQPQAVLQILAGADVQAALPQEHVAPIHRAGAGQTGDRVHDVEDGPPCADRHQVLDALQSGPYQVALVADRDVAARAADARIAECGRKPRHRRRIEHRVRIHGQKQIAAGKSGRGVDCRAAAAARAMADDHVDQALRAGPLRDGARFVGRAVIDDDDFDRPQGLPLQRHDRGVKPGAAVEGRHDHADRSIAGRRCGRPIATRRIKRAKPATTCSEECRISAPRKRAGASWIRRAAGSGRACRATSSAMVAGSAQSRCRSISNRAAPS